MDKKSERENMTLDVVIATYSPEGIERVSKMNLPKYDDVNYIVSWQNHQNFPLPENLKREDVKIYRMEGKGLSKNRNNAIFHSNSDLIYIADDDIIILPEAIPKIIQCFKDYPDTDVATFKMLEEGRKNYPREITKLNFYLPKNYSVGSCQMGFKKDVFNKVKFNENYGINSGCFEVGEDEIFHLEARKKGLICRFFPIVVASHPHDASGNKVINNPNVIEGFGAIITKSYPKSFLLRLPLKALRLHRSKKYGFFPSLLHLVKGSMKCKKLH